MARLVDTSLWIDFTRARSPRALKAFVAPYIEDPAACLAEPIIFEVLRHANDDETRLLSEIFESMLLLETPPDVWRLGASLGRACRRRGHTAGSLDLLIAATALLNGAELVTFDADFEAIAEVAPLRLTSLKRPVQ
jgi:predicted nucleic acid-binding protein